MGLDAGGRLTLERATSRAVVRRDPPPSAAELVHPYLAAIAAVASWWNGRIALHAGAFEVRGCCWAVLGDAGSGKSSLVAAVTACGARPVTDDLLVTDGAVAMSGPTCVDLRADVAAALGVGMRIDTVGGRERWRITTEPGRPEVPLGGFVLPRWADALSIAELPPAERLPPLVRALSLALRPARPGLLLRLAGLPMVSLTRPRGIAGIGAIGESLLAAVG